ncbi:MAG: ATP-binding protein [Cyanobacteria bacterium P01_D01_bin.71]
MLKPTSIRKRIVMGYVLPLCVAVSGIATGLVIGKNHTNQALKVQEVTISERKLLDTIRLRLLAYRPTKDFAPTLASQDAFRAESERLLTLLKEVQVLTASLRDIHSEVDHAVDLSVIQASLQYDPNETRPDVHEAATGGNPDQIITSINQLEDHQVIYDTLDGLEVAIIDFEQRAQRFISEVEGLTGYSNRQALSQQALLRFVQDPEFHQILSAIDQLGAFDTQLELRESAANAALNDAFRLQTLIILLSLLISVLLASLVAWQNSRAIAHPLTTVTDIARRVTQENDFSLRASVHSQDEVGILANALNQLIQQVQQLLDSVKQKNTDLSEALSQLKEQQVQLVQAEKMSSLGQLVAGVAHEINNPVNFIHGNIAHIKEHVDDVLLLLDELRERHPEAIADIEETYEDLELDFIQEDLGKILTSMRVGTGRIREIVVSLRNFSRLDEADYKAVNLHEGIDGSLMILCHRLKASYERPAIEVKRNYGELPIVECYPGQLNQVILNILTNGIDAIEERYFREPKTQPKMPLTITVETQLWQENWVEIAIKDTGIVMSEKAKQRIFEKFYTTKSAGAGTGLGMSISHQIIVDIHHGELAFESTQNQGTTFFIRIPIQQDWKIPAVQNADDLAAAGIN